MLYKDQKYTYNLASLLDVEKPARPDATRAQQDGQGSLKTKQPIGVGAC